MAEQKSLVYIQHKTDFLQNPFWASMYHLWKNEHAMLFLRIGETQDRTGMQNRAEPLRDCPFLSNTNVLKRIPKLSFTKTVFDIKAAPGASDSRAVL